MSFTSRDEVLELQIRFARTRWEEAAKKCDALRKSTIPATPKEVLDAEAEHKAAWADLCELKARRTPDTASNLDEERLARARAAGL